MVIEPPATSAIERASVSSPSVTPSSAQRMMWYFTQSSHRKTSDAANPKSSLTLAGSAPAR
jgi:hypothetical protein